VIFLVYIYLIKKFEDYKKKKIIIIIIMFMYQNLSKKRLI
jgi:hypothetical protein